VPDEELDGLPMGEPEPSPNPIPPVIDPGLSGGDEPSVDPSLPGNGGAWALQLRRAVELYVRYAALDESDMITLADLYEAWAPGVEYMAFYVIKHGVDINGRTALYSVAQAHTSAQNLPPGDAPELYTRIGVSPGGAPIWVQPLGAGDAYAQGNTVAHNNETWVSDINANVWEPGVDGWTQQNE